MELLTSIITGIFGLIVGSFLNVVILRMNTGRGIGGRSQCFSCNKTLTWKELIPVVSFLLLRGKCKNCRSKISWQYPIVELITGLLFAGVAWAIDPILFPVTFILWLLLVSVGVVIAVYDVLHQIIVEEALILFLGLCIAIGMHGLGFLIVPLPFLILWIISRGAWIGFGDVELMACIGMLLGISGGINAVVIAFWSACIVVLPWYLVNKWSKRKVSHKVPFGPFLLMGTYLVGICGIRVITLMMHVLQ